jgi:hypothetical protein
VSQGDQQSTRALCWGNRPLHASHRLLWSNDRDSNTCRAASSVKQSAVMERFGDGLTSKGCWANCR